MRVSSPLWLLAGSLFALAGCSDDAPKAASERRADGGMEATGGETGSGGSPSSDASAEARAASDGKSELEAGTSTRDAAREGGGPDASKDDSLCAKYGGPDVVMGVMRNQVLSEIAGDCRVNAFFAVVDPVIVDHVGQCLGFMAQELFGCPGVTYAGSESDTGRECRSMEESHRGLRISQGDFDALLEDVVAGLSAAGVEQADIESAAPALIGMKDDIVEAPDNSSTTQEACELDGGGPDATSDASEGGTSEAGAPPPDAGEGG